MLLSGVLVITHDTFLLWPLSPTISIENACPYNEAEKQQNLVIRSLLHVSIFNSLGARMDMHMYTQAYRLSSFKKSGARWVLLNFYLLTMLTLGHTYVYKHVVDRKVLQQIATYVCLTYTQKFNCPLYGAYIYL